MYVPDGRERVVVAEQFPRVLEGAPCPTLLGDEREMWLAYYCVPNISDDERDPVLVEPTKSILPVAIIKFDSFALYSGTPNLDDLRSHPLATKGIDGPGVFEVQSSSWLRELAPPSGFSKFNKGENRSWKHYIFVFHDSIIETVARISTVKVIEAPLRDALFRAFFQ